MYPLCSSLFQNMTNQLIELERHFNGLELNKFGGNDETQVNERALQRKFGSSRYVKFCSVRNLLALLPFAFQLVVLSSPTHVSSSKFVSGKVIPYIV